MAKKACRFRDAHTRGVVNSATKLSTCGYWSRANGGSAKIESAQDVVLTPSMNLASTLGIGATRTCHSETAGRPSEADVTYHRRARPLEQELVVSIGVGVNRVDTAGDDPQTTLCDTRKDPPGALLAPVGPLVASPDAVTSSLRTDRYNAVPASKS